MKTIAFPSMETCHPLTLSWHRPRDKRLLHENPTIGMQLTWLASEFGNSGSNEPSYYVLVWNLTIAALLEVAARRAVHKHSNVSGAWD